MVKQMPGNVIAIINYTFWGLLPLYYQFVQVDEIAELFFVRILASVPCLYIAFVIFKQPWPSFSKMLAKKRDCLMVALSGIFISISWCTFTYTITHGHVLEASLGFFIAPLFAIAFGILIGKDKLDGFQITAIVFAIAGVGFQVLMHKQLPVSSLVMALTFTLYGLCKKYTDFDLLVSLMLETLVIVPFALVYVVVAGFQGELQILNDDWKTLWLFLGAAPMTLIPYLLYTAAVRKTSLTMMGLLHYIEPSLQFCLALLYFHEPLDWIKATSFALIWFGLLVCSWPGVMRLVQQKKKGAMKHCLRLD